MSHADLPCCACWAAVGSLHASGRLRSASIQKSVLTSLLSTRFQLHVANPPQRVLLTSTSPPGWPSPLSLHRRLACDTILDLVSYKGNSYAIKPNSALSLSDASDYAHLRSLLRPPLRMAKLYWRKCEADMSNKCCVSHCCASQILQHQNRRKCIDKARHL